LPVVENQSYYAVLGYDPRRREKIQELAAQSFEKFQRDKQPPKKSPLKSISILLQNAAGNSIIAP
jgi:hypothetical protein